jgi:nucleotide-binding universal stress UspA family protein
MSDAYDFTLSPGQPTVFGPSPPVFGFDLSSFPNILSPGLYSAVDDITPPLTGPVNMPNETGFLASLRDITNGIVGATQNFYGAQAQIEHAKAQAAVAKAQGQNAVQVARAGLPSPQVLLLGGGALLALLIVTGGSGSGRRR